jgi:hypothetical protein
LSGEELNKEIEEVEQRLQQVGNEIVHFQPNMHASEKFEEIQRKLNELTGK